MKSKENREFDLFPVYNSNIFTRRGRTLIAAEHRNEPPTLHMFPLQDVLVVTIAKLVTTRSPKQLDNTLPAR